MPRRAAARAQRGAVGRLSPQLIQALQQEEKQRQVIVSPPWRGYMPDLNAAELTFAAAQSCVDMVVRGDFLEPDDGWGFQGTALPFAVNQPCVMATHFYFNENVSPPSVQNLAMTQAFGTSSGAGHLYTQSPLVSGTWTEIAFSTGVGVVGSAINAPTLDGTGGIWIPDYSVCPNMSGTSINGAFLFTNGLDMVYQYPDTYSGSSALSGLTGTTQSTNVVLMTSTTGVVVGMMVTDTTHPGDIPALTYVLSIVPNTSITLSQSAVGSHAGDSLNFYNTFGNSAVYAGLVTNFGSTFRARSVCQWYDRAMFLNTVESSTTDFHPRRLRWAPIAAGGGGQPINFLAVGGGFIDLDSYGGQGLRVLPQGTNWVVCYLTDGTARVARTGNPAVPFAEELTTNKRAILGKNAVCDLGGGVHFCICNDGWYIFDYTGTWTELGRFQGVNVQTRLDTADRSLYKWKDTFYQMLSALYNPFIYTYYRPDKKFVYITFTSNQSIDGYPDQTWIYDTQLDAVFPQNYVISGSDFRAVCWGEMQEVVSTGTIYGTTPGTFPTTLDGTSYNQLNGVSYNQMSGVLGPLRLVHGTKVAGAAGGTSASVFFHDPRIVNQTRNGVLPVGSWQSFLISQGQPRTLKNLEHVGIEYENVGPSLFNLFAYTNSGALSASGQALPTTGSMGQPQYTYITTRLQGTHFGFILTVPAPFKIRTLRMEQQMEPEARRPIGT